MFERLRFVVRTTVEWSCAALLGLYVLFFLYRAALVVPYPYPLQFIEGAVHYQALRLKAGEALYPSIHSGPPFVAPVYTPVYPALLSLIYGVVEPQLLWGRLVSFLALMASLGLLARLVWAETGVSWVAVLSAALATGLGAVYEWGVLYRVDVLAIAFSLGGFSLIRKEARPLHLMSAALLFVIAFYTKQSFVAAPLAAGLFYLTERSLRFSTRLRWAGLVLGTWITITGLVFVLLDVTTGGQFLLHTVIYKRQPWEWSRWFDFVRLSIQTYGALWIAAVWSAWRVRQSPVGRALSLYFVLSSAGMLFMFGLLGAATNYMLEPLLVGSALIGLGLASVLTRPNLRLALFAALLLELILVRHVPVLRDQAFTPRADTRMLGDQVAARVASEPGLVLADDVGWVLAAGGRPVLDDPVLFTDLSRQGLWDEAAVVRLLRDGQIGLILTFYDPGRGSCLYPPGMCAVIRSDYCLTETIGTLQVYWPRDRGCSVAGSAILTIGQ